MNISSEDKFIFMIRKKTRKYSLTGFNLRLKSDLEQTVHTI